jgi:hypothetical protein
VNRKQAYFVFTDRSEASNRRPREAADVMDLPCISLVGNHELRVFERQLMQKKDHRFLGLQLLERVLDMLKPSTGGVLLLDVMTSAFVGDVHRQATLAYHLREICSLCEERKLTIVGTAYGVKTMGDPKTLYSRPIDRIVGAQSMRGSAGTILYLCHPQEGQDAKAPPSYDQEFWIQARDKESRVFRIVNKGLFVMSDEEHQVEDEETEKLVAGPKSAGGTSSRVPARQLLLDLLPFEATAFETILQLAREGWRASLSKPYLSNMLAQLEAEGKVKRGVEKGQWLRVHDTSTVEAVAAAVDEALDKTEPDA